MKKALSKGAKLSNISFTPSKRRQGEGWNRAVPDWWRVAAFALGGILIDEVMLGYELEM
jgi:hypothetical protein